MRPTTSEQTEQLRLPISQVFFDFYLNFSTISSDRLFLLFIQTFLVTLRTKTHSRNDLAQLLEGVKAMKVAEL